MGAWCGVCGEFPVYIVRCMSKIVLYLVLDYCGVALVGFVDGHVVIIY